MKKHSKIIQRLEKIYGENISEDQINDILGLISTCEKSSVSRTGWTQNDIILIAYGDSIRREGSVPLEILRRFLTEKLLDEISVVHILPFFPYSSDDGFSVIDYLEVDPVLGSWEDVAELGESFDLMFDFVVNHISKKSQWFGNYIAGKDPGKEFFVEANPGTDLSEVIRPRSLPLLTPFETVSGKRYVWTTFSDDQVDLDFSNPDLLFQMLKILIDYIEKGARIIRLDAIAFLWKKVGTTCLHLPETHEMVKLFRDIAEIVNPETVILTETNVPNMENLSYFGEGDEAHMIYQFSLPPLLLEALFTGDTTYLNDWASAVPEPPGGCTYFNFTASHDGIGVRPLEGLLPEDRKKNLFSAMKESGGMISTRRNSDGTDIPYELNITYFDAMKRCHEGEDAYQAERFIASQSIMLMLQGIPAFYIHSLMSTSNYLEGVRQTGRARTINRKKLDYATLMDELNNDKTRKFVLNELCHRIRIRKQEPLFHPDNPQKVIYLDESFFVVKRFNTESGRELVSITNFKSYPVEADRRELFQKPGVVINILNNRVLHGISVALGPYETKWLLME